MGTGSPGDPRGAEPQKRAKRGTTLKLSDLDDYFKDDSSQTGLETYIHIKSVDNVPIAKRNRFLVAKYLKNITSNIIKASYNSKGEMIVKVKGAIEAEKLMKITKIGDWPVTAERHQRLNASKGIVYNRDLCWMTEKEIVDGLADYKATEVYIFKRTPRFAEDGASRESKPYGLVVITFDTIKPPEEIKFGFERLKVRQYIPNPKRCKKCQKLGHTMGSCKSKKAACDQCGQNSEGDSMPVHTCNVKFCVNCNKPGHAASDRNCPKYIMEKEAIIISINEGMDMYHARTACYQRYPSIETLLRTKGKSLAQIVTLAAKTSTAITTVETNKQEAENNTGNPKGNTTQESKGSSTENNTIVEVTETNQQVVLGNVEKNTKTLTVNSNYTNKKANIREENSSKRSFIKLRSYTVDKGVVTYFLSNGIQKGKTPELDLTKFKGKKLELHKKALTHANRIINREEMLKQISVEVDKKNNCNRIIIRVAKGRAKITALDEEEESSSEDQMSIDEENQLN